MAGRPTLYSEEMLEKAKDYLANGDYVVPSVTGMCLHIGVSRKTCYSWCDQGHDEFADIMDAINETQEVSLISKGLTGDFNPSIVKMLLARHGYAEKTETDITTKGNALNTWTINPVTTVKDASD